MRTLKLNNIFKSDADLTDSNLQVLLDVIDTGANTEKLFTKNKVMSLVELQEQLNDNESNILSKEQVKATLGSLTESGSYMSIPDSTYRQVKEHKEPLTLSEILMHLSKMRSKFIYNPEFYKDVLGGYTFSDFTPKFETAKLNADKLIVSNSKLNIVLVSTMEGLVNVNGYDQPMMRFVPFKLVKQGDITIDTLEVQMDERNRDLLMSLPHKSLTGTIVSIHLQKYQSIVSTEFTIKSLVEVIASIASLKSVIRAYNYVMSGLKEYIAREEMYDNEWYRGEAVDDDYVSDEGTDRIEVWIKGRKKTPNMSDIFRNTAHLAEIAHIKMLVDSTIDIYDFNCDTEFKSTVDTLGASLHKLFLKGEINEIIYLAISTLLQTSLIEGTPIHRYEEIKKKKSAISNMLNSLELKLLPVRKKILETTDGIDVSDNLYLYSLGRPDGGNADTLGIYCPEAKQTVMFKISKITKPVRDNNADDEEDSLTATQISTDPRSEI